MRRFRFIVRSLLLGESIKRNLFEGFLFLLKYKLLLLAPQFQLFMSFFSRTFSPATIFALILSTLLASTHSLFVRVGLAIRVVVFILPASASFRNFASSIGTIFHVRDQFF